MSDPHQRSWYLQVVHRMADQNKLQVTISKIQKDTQQATATLIDQKTPS